MRRLQPEVHLVRGRGRVRGEALGLGSGLGLGLGLGLEPEVHRRLEAHREPGGRGGGEVDEQVREGNLAARRLLPLLLLLLLLLGARGVVQLACERLVTVRMRVRVRVRVGVRVELQRDR